MVARSRSLVHNVPMVASLARFTSRAPFVRALRDARRLHLEDEQVKQINNSNFASPETRTMLLSPPKR